MIRNPAFLYEMFESCLSELEELGPRTGLSSYVNVTQLLGKSLLLSCASFYEDELVRIIKRAVESGNYPKSLITWINNVAIDGQFYKWFDFRNTKNSNAFIGKFGQEFKLKMRTIIDSKDLRKKSEADFMELCRKRNESVHRNYATYSLDLTINDINEKHRSAMGFIRIVDYGVRKWLTL